MALHKDFPASPHALLDPALRWFPADEALRETSMEKLMPPLVPAVRRKVQEFRTGGYVGATDTSRSMLHWWFDTPHLLPKADGTMAEFQYYFAQTIMKDLCLVSGHDVLYGKVKAFVQEDLFDRKVELESPNTLRNLSELAATKTLIETFKKAINALTVQDKGEAEIRDTIKLRRTRPFVAKDQGYLVPKKSVFNRIIGDEHFELSFAGFLEDCNDVVSYAKNYLAVHFKLDYQNADGDISSYYPDFLVKVSAKRIFIVETKGRADLDVPLKMHPLRQWCEDINRVQADVKYDFVYVDEDSFERYKPTSFKQLIDGFREYKEDP